LPFGFIYSTGNRPKPAWTPAGAPQQKALAFLAKSTLPRLCLLWFNMSELLYVD